MYVLFSRKSAAFMLDIIPDSAEGTMMMGGRVSFDPGSFPLTGLLLPVEGRSPLCFLFLSLEPLEESVGAARPFALRASALRMCSLNSLRAKLKS